MKIWIKGEGEPIVGIVGCLHGNETLGKEVIGCLYNIEPKKGTILYIVANEEAMAEQRRFIDVDLNRCFPGACTGTHEEKLATTLLKELAECDYVLDIHSTTADTENFIIITRNNLATRTLASFIPLNKVVFMGKTIAKGKALIDHVSCGVSLECNANTPVASVEKLVISCLIRLGVLQGVAPTLSQEYYYVYGILKRYKETRMLENFKQSNIGGELFYPILFGEKEYKDIICFKSKKKLLLSQDESLSFNLIN